jgi:hypothetical protein
MPINRMPTRSLWLVTASWCAPDVRVDEPVVARARDHPQIQDLRFDGAHGA